jgi:hypothetical protein
MADPLADREDINHGFASDTISAVYWQVAPDHRMLRTLDWMNDACEAKLRAKHRPAGGALTYRAIMSPVRVQISRRIGTKSLTWPVTVLITDSWLILATKKPIFRWARVRKFNRGAITAANCPTFEFLTDEELNRFNDLLPNVEAKIGTRYASS